MAQEWVLAAGERVPGSQLRWLLPGPAVGVTVPLSPQGWDFNPGWGQAGEADACQAASKACRKPPAWLPPTTPGQERAAPLSPPISSCERWGGEVGGERKEGARSAPPCKQVLGGWTEPSLRFLSL